MTSRPSTAAPILAVLAVVLPFGLYVGGYFWLGEREDVLSEHDEVIIVKRKYPAKWLLDIYEPAARVEEICWRIDVWPRLSEP